MNQTDLLIARAQVGLAFLFALGFIAVLFVLVFFHSGLSDTANTLLTGLLGVFGTVLTLQQNYFFARHRPPTSGDEDPSAPSAPPIQNNPPNGESR